MELKCTQQLLCEKLKNEDYDSYAIFVSKNENEFFLHVYQKFDPLYKAKKIISMKNIEYIRQQFTEEEFV